MRTPQLPMNATALQKLDLFAVHTTSELVQAICDALPSLTDLKLIVCIDASKGSKICTGPATRLR